MSEEKDNLRADFEVFEHNRKDWFRSNPNDFVVVCKGEVAGFYPDYESGLRAGVQKFGVKSQFLVKQVCAEEPVFVIY
jgi:hypothetical protein